MTRDATERLCQLCRSYIRASTDDQKLTVEAQEAEHRQWCETQGHELAGVYSDPGVKGARAIEKCKGMQALLDDLQPGEIVIVSNRKRIARSVLKSFMFESEVEERGASIFSLDNVGNGTDDAAWLHRAIDAVFGEYEARQTRDRTRKIARHLKRTGQRHTSRYYGYTPIPNGKLDKRGRPRFNLVPSEDEQRWLSVMREMRSQRFSLQEIADYLNGQDVPAPNGGAWLKGTIARILERETVG